MKKKPVLDQDEEERIAEYERGVFRLVKNQDRVRQVAVEAVRRYMRKDTRIKIRLLTADREMLKRRVVEGGCSIKA